MSSCASIMVAFATYTLEYAQIYCHHEETLFFTKQDQALPQKLIQSNYFATVKILGVDQEPSTIYFNIITVQECCIGKNITKKNRKNLK